MKSALGEVAFGILQSELGIRDEYRMTELQAEAILRMQLGQLANSRTRRNFEGVQPACAKKSAATKSLLGSEGAASTTIIRADLAQMRDRFGNDRRTEITDDGGDVEMEDLISDEPTVVMLSHEGFIKRLPVETYRIQARGRQGRAGGLRDNDFIEHFFTATYQVVTMLCFTDRGQMLLAQGLWRVPEASRTSQWAIDRQRAFIERRTRRSRASSRCASSKKGTYLLMATRQGLVKKTSARSSTADRAKGGIIGINLEEGDTLIARLPHPGGRRSGTEYPRKGWRFASMNPTRGRWGAVPPAFTASNSTKTKEDDVLVGMVVADPDGFLLTLCENGYGKRTPFGTNEYRRARSGG